MVFNQCKTYALSTIFYIIPQNRQMFSLGKPFVPYAKSFNMSAQRGWIPNSSWTRGKGSEHRDPSVSTKIPSISDCQCKSISEYVLLIKKCVYIYRYWHFALYPQNISTPNIKYKHWETYQKGHHRKSREPITPPLHYLGPFLVAVRHPDGANCWVGHSLHLILRMVITALIGNPSNGYINPYSWVDNHLLYHGNPRETWISLGASYNPYIAALKLRHFPCFFFFFSGPSVSWCFVVPSPILTNMPIVKVAIISRNGRYKQNDWNHRVQVESDDCHWIILSRNWM